MVDMAQNSARRNEYEIDPMFYIPEGMEDFVYSENTEDAGSEADAAVEETVYDDSYITEEGEGMEYPDAPEVPDILGIIPPQIIRTTATGNQVIDVTIEVEDIPGISNYEIRVTKR